MLWDFSIGLLMLHQPSDSFLANRSYPQPCTNLNKHLITLLIHVLYCIDMEDLILNQSVCCASSVYITL